MESWQGDARLCAQQKQSPAACPPTQQQEEAHRSPLPSLAEWEPHWPQGPGPSLFRDGPRRRVEHCPSSPDDPPTGNSGVGGKDLARQVSWPGRSPCLGRQVLPQKKAPVALRLPCSLWTRGQRGPSYGRWPGSEGPVPFPSDRRKQGAAFKVS